jgi:multiple sugar transport system ATP-binding protein
MAKVLISKLVKDYKGPKKESIRAVHSIDLEVKDGEFMVLVGPSGCGKSTTLRMIAGLEDITDGEIRIDGNMVNDVAPKDRDIAMVFQNYALYPHMSVYDNMAFGLKLMKFSKEDIRERVDRAAQILGIGDLLERKPKALSGGQRQRIAVGRAIVRNPKVFLFDEPLSNLDAKMRVSMRAEISKLHSQLSSTMIYVTHDQVEAMTMGDRICVMKDGVIMQVADPLTIYNHPANLFVAGFIGSPPMNFLRGRLVGDGESLHFIDNDDSGREVDIALTKDLSLRAVDYRDREVVLGVRPENVTVASEAPVLRGEGDRAEFMAKVYVVEPMGSETYLHLGTGYHSFVARVSSDNRFEVNEDVNLCIDLAKSHLFDPESGAVIS